MTKMTYVHHYKGRFYHNCLALSYTDHGVCKKWTRLLGHTVYIYIYICVFSASKEKCFLYFGVAEKINYVFIQRTHQIQSAGGAEKTRHSRGERRVQESPPPSTSKKCTWIYINLPFTDGY